MSNALAAEYAYRALATRDTARTFRKFGYHASAAMLEKRAEAYDRRSELESKEAPQDEPCGASRASHPTESQDDDLHRTSEVNQEPGLF